MKTSKEYHALLSAMEKTARTYQGAWSAFSKANRHGIAAFADYEVKERLLSAEKIAQHLVEHEEHVLYAAIAAPACDYKTPVDAVTALCKAEDELYEVALSAYDSVVEAGERPYFLQLEMQKIKREREEIAAVRSMLESALDPKSMEQLNKKLLMKYTKSYA